MRTLAPLLIVALLSATSQAAFITNVDPMNSTDWIPVTIDPPAEFQPISQILAFVYTQNASHTGGGAIALATPTSTFWLKRDVDTLSPWWLDIGFILQGSPIGGGENQFLLRRDNATAASLVLRPKPQLYPPLTPPNNRVTWARFWTIDDGTPHDELAVTAFRPVPEPSSSLLALTALTVGSICRRSRCD